MSTMALKQVRDELRATSDHADTEYDKAWAIRLAEAIDAHLREREAVAPMLANAPGSAHLDEDPIAMARVFCEAIIEHQYQDPSHGGHLCVEVAPLLKAINAQRDASLTKADARVPDDWQLVPHRATPAMVVAADEAWDGAGVRMERIYEAMLAAAPKPEKGE